MKNLYVKIGRAEPHCIGTFPDDVSADGAQAAKAADLQRAGVAPERVEFTRADAGVAPNPEVQSKRKGKK